MLSRVTKRFNYTLLSASRDQVFSQDQSYAVPLVAEPPKVIFYSPVSIFDFQSLYPSIIIAYNICYSTCVGRFVDKNTFNIEKTENIDDTLIINKKIGVFYLRRSLLSIFKKSLAKYQIIGEENIINFILENTIISPNNVVFVKENIRVGVLPRILKELLLTRIMIKDSMKLISDPNRKKILDNRQLGLKLYANVTYGYTSAGFSGRMPCGEVAESIVSFGRLHLTKTISKISKMKYDELQVNKYKNNEINLKNEIDENGNSKFHPEVIYGDTDSCFVLFKNLSLRQTFEFSNLIAKLITSKIPEPMKLQFEKVYLPCYFFSKKRYCGYKYEKYDKRAIQVKKINEKGDSYFINERIEFPLESKGIEIVRRDGCKLTSVILERIIKILFETKDISLLKEYLKNSFVKLIKGKTDPSNFVIAKEVKLGTYKNLPPSAIAAFKLHEKDVNYLPLFGERVGFVVVNKQSNDTRSNNQTNKFKLKDAIEPIKHYILNMLNNKIEKSQIITLLMKKYHYSKMENLKLIDRKDDEEYNLSCIVSDMVNSDVNEFIFKGTNLNRLKFPKINYYYYIEKHIMPIVFRLFENIGVDFNQWNNKTICYLKSLQTKLLISENMNISYIEDINNFIKSNSKKLLFKDLIKQGKNSKNNIMGFIFSKGNKSSFNFSKAVKCGSKNDLLKKTTENEEEADLNRPRYFEDFVDYIKSLKNCQDYENHINNNFLYSNICSKCSNNTCFNSDYFKSVECYNYNCKLFNIINK